MIQRLFFELRYLFGDPPWDSGVTPPELLAFLGAHPPGRAIDLGCGTGTNVITMAQRGWEVVGVDFSSCAIRSARRKARAADVKVALYRADVTRLEGLGIQGPFDLALDIGCFHVFGEKSTQDQYACQLSRLLRPAGTFLLYSFVHEGLDEGTIRDRFERTFTLTEVVRGTDTADGRASAWFTMRRKA